MIMKNDAFMPLCIMLPKMSAYGKDVDRTKYMSFMIKDNKLPEKHNKIWDDSESVYHEKFSQIVGSNF